ncbi:MAG: hypothetical protein RMJ98_01525 [Myxococcales bacterium]|nr:hypothetical protein [Polyangiaceae bacterium]MDW8247967.1 hypothetical protein [Myxococcales bacterium]
MPATLPGEGLVARSVKEAPAVQTIKEAPVERRVPEGEQEWVREAPRGKVVRWVREVPPVRGGPQGKGRRGEQRAALQVCQVLLALAVPLLGMTRVA